MILSYAAEGFSFSNTIPFGKLISFEITIEPHHKIT
jgi:hypothetical protein